MTDEDSEGLSPYTTAKGILYLTAKDLSAVVSGAVFFVFIARFLPSLSDLGFITGMQTIIAFFAILSSLGLARSATRFIPYYIGSGENAKAKGLYAIIFRIGLISSGAFSTVLYILGPYLAGLLFHDLKYASLIQLSSLDIFLYSMSTFCMFLLFASQKFIQVTIVSVLNSLLKFPAALILFATGMGLQGIVMGLILGDGITMVIYVYLLCSKIRVRPTSLRDFKSLLNYSIPLYGSMILNFLSTKIDIYLLMFLSSLYALGVYSPAVFIASVFSVVPAALDQAILPYTARIFGKSGMSSLDISSYFVSRYLFLVFMPLGFFTVALTPKLIILLLGERFSDSIYPTMLLVLVITLTSVVVVFNNILRTAGYTGFVMKADAIALPFQVIVSVASIPYFGPLGAAFARTTSRIIFFFYIVYKLRRITELNYDKKAFKMGLIGSIIMALIIFSFDLYIKHVYYLPFVLIVAIISYLLFLRFTYTVNIKDVEVLNNIFPLRLKWFMRLVAKIVIHGKHS